jgi:hypothetical protein
MKVAPAMLLKTRSAFRQFAAHPVMFMKTNWFLSILSMLLKKRAVLKTEPANHRLPSSIVVVAAIQSTNKELASRGAPPDFGCPMMLMIIKRLELDRV